jgi:hypothetical protein
MYYVNIYIFIYLYIILINCLLIVTFLGHLTLCAVGRRQNLNMLPPQLAEATESLKRDLRCALPPTLLIIALVFILPLTGSRPLGNLHVKNAVGETNC